jgi:hypothetical protein
MMKKKHDLQSVLAFADGLFDIRVELADLEKAVPVVDISADELRSVLKAAQNFQATARAANEVASRLLVLAVNKADHDSLERRLRAQIAAEKSPPA